ncbi:transcriptional regulator [Paenibacillus selenitireducens]|uniref:Transcriptional regulator n=1 Tax=Paenibacillus selenitireducens TaxID=1324314 RepID=A0A1T2XKF7_9BACL|nr:helix-turn-helix transcriptional regulator [Paenibacillus selenitireducens]OPA80308.1 transcriptional regulator [Paenibacillus selenitireducens]
MKVELGRCLLPERLQEAQMTIEQLARVLLYRPERLTDFIENKRIMSLKIAISIANTLGCDVRDLYETMPSLPVAFDSKE